MTLRYAIENQRSVHIHADMQREQCVVEMVQGKKEGCISRFSPIPGPAKDSRALALFSEIWSGYGGTGELLIRDHGCSILAENRTTCL